MVTSNDAVRPREKRRDNVLVASSQVVSNENGSGTAQDGEHPGKQEVRPLIHV